MKIGYARVSTLEQNLDLQVKALEKEGCGKIFQDKVSGVKAERPQLQQALNYIREGDTLVIWRLDRLGRSLKHLIELVGDLEEKGISLKSLTESIDTGTNGGKLIFHIFGALAEFERNLIRERTLAGLKAARARGRVGGRPKKLDAKKQAILLRLYEERELSINEICETMGVSRPTLYKYVNEAKNRNLSTSA